MTKDVTTGPSVGRVTHPMLVGGQRVVADSGESIIVRDPATDAIVGVVPRAGAGETKRAIDSASVAAAGWRRTPIGERARVLRSLAAAVQNEQDRLAHLLTEEQGKPIRESMAEIRTAAAYFDGAAGDIERLRGESWASPGGDKRIMVMHHPVGVVAAITPWNFPSVIPARKVAPALAAGCTVVLKPSSAAPLSGIAIADLALDAGLPPGVLNVVTGDARAVADAFLDDERVRKISLTGSTEAGRYLIRGSARNITRLTLELGGHAPFLIFDDADLDAAIAGLMASKFRNGGQTCICANRVFVQAGIADEFRTAVAKRMRELKVGPGSDPTTDIGPLINDDAVTKVERHIADALGSGAELVVGGGRTMVSGHTDRFFAPTLVDGVTRAMEISREETFGPVLPMTTFDTESEAIALANDSDYGLAAYYYTKDGARIIRIAESLEAGILGANDGTPSAPGVPLGGMGWSGYGREGGRWGLEDYMEIKYLSWGGHAV